MTFLQQVAEKIVHDPEIYELLSTTGFNINSSNLGNALIKEYLRRDEKISDSYSQEYLVWYIKNRMCIDLILEQIGKIEPVTYLTSLVDDKLDSWDIFIDSAKPLSNKQFEVVLGVVNPHTGEVYDVKFLYYAPQFEFVSDYWVESRPEDTKCLELSIRAFDQSQKRSLVTLEGLSVDYCLSEIKHILQKLNITKF